MQKRDDAFRSIGEVAGLIGVPPHVLRYWETQFPQLKPMKRPDGRRYYRPEDVRLAAGLCELLRDDGLTIRGARKLIAQDRGEAVRARGQARLDEGALTAKAEPTAAQPVAEPDAVPAKAAIEDRRPPLAAADAFEAASAEDAHPRSDAPFSPAPPEDDEMALPEDEPEPPHRPHARHRHRHRHAPAEGQMALFEGPPPPAATWLPRLARMAAALQAQDPASARWQRAAPLALRLGHAIARLH